MNPFLSDDDLKVDPIHQDLGLETELGMEIWRGKYRWAEEEGLAETFERVVGGIYKDDPQDDAALQAVYAMQAGLWMPAGRILAGAGTAKRVTLMNCYVNERLPDSMEGIMQGNTNAALTMQQGGGMGTAFGSLRPAGALLRRTHTRASGPIPFMDMYCGMGKTIRSAGDRRGAQMMTLPDWHPDLVEFIKAKQTPGRMTETNISILISDAFMEAVREDEEWLLYFPCEPHSRDPELEQYDFIDEDTEVKNWVYSAWKARELWDLITRATYEYSEPGVLFVDRINELNNLHYLEYIDCTNPCGEQPLPPNGACNLGHVVLSRMVRNPFTSKAYINWNTLRRVAQIGTRFLDNVIDVSGYPLPAQEEEQRQKRRIGLGFTGIADAFNMLGIRYGSPQSADLAERIMKEICLSVYEESVDLAAERGAFPLFDADKYLAPNTFAGSRLPRELQDQIRKDGIRNGVLLTLAPTGTTSIVYGNGASGVEPVFAHSYDRRVRGKEIDEWHVHKVEGYSSRLYKHLNPGAELPNHMVTMADLTIEDHVIIQARVQGWVDASVSKTVNIPKEMAYEDFVRVYDLAYQSGCKGCTTYRPSDVRGSILSTGKETSQGKEVDASQALTPRPADLPGTTYKLKWPRRKAALYVTINNDPETGRPYEMFIASKDGTAAEWMMALALMVTAIFRTNPDPSFIAYELKQIESTDFARVDNVFYGSLPAYLGSVIETHMQSSIAPEQPATPAYMLKTSKSGNWAIVSETPLMTEQKGETCPECKQPAVFMVEGCKKCQSCGYSAC